MTLWIFTFYASRAHIAKWRQRIFLSSIFLFWVCDTITILRKMVLNDVAICVRVCARECTQQVFQFWSDDNWRMSRDRLWTKTIIIIIMASARAHVALKRRTFRKCSFCLARFFSCKRKMVKPCRWRNTFTHACTTRRSSFFTSTPPKNVIFIMTTNSKWKADKKKKVYFCWCTGKERGGATQDIDRLINITK